MKKGLTLTIRKILEVKNDEAYEDKVDQLVSDLEDKGWIVDTDTNDPDDPDDFDEDYDEVDGEEDDFDDDGDEDEEDEEDEEGDDL